MKRGRQSEEHGSLDDNTREDKKKKEDEPAGEEEVGPHGLERVGDDVLMLIMEFCGPALAAHAFLLANRHLNALVRRHHPLWRHAYAQLFEDEFAHPKEDAQAKLAQHLAEVEDPFGAYVAVMARWTGAVEFREDGVPLGETDGDLTIKVGPDGRATWEGFGVGCGRAGEYFSLNCLKGEGKLVLRLNKKGEPEAFVNGYENDKHDTCAMPGRKDDQDDDDDDDDEVDDDDVEDVSKWVEESLKDLGSFFISRVEYKLHSRGKRVWCTGGGACASWYEDMEW